MDSQIRIGSAYDAGLLQQSSRERSLPLYLLVLGFIALWTGGAVLAPIGMAHGWVTADQQAIIRGDHRLPDLLAFIVRASYGLVCHQLPGRSLWIQGHPMAVCARCFGIYVGYLAGLLVYPAARSRLEIGLPRPRWLILAFLPLLIDFLGGYFRIFDNTTLSRIGTGLIAGTAIAIYTATGLIAATRVVLATIFPWRKSLPLRESGGARNA